MKRTVIINFNWSTGLSNKEQQLTDRNACTVFERCWVRFQSEAVYPCWVLWRDEQQRARASPMLISIIIRALWYRHRKYETIEAINQYRYIDTRISIHISIHLARPYFQMTKRNINRLPAHPWLYSCWIWSVILTERENILIGIFEFMTQMTWKMEIT
jgi:hypothetical protein